MTARILTRAEVAATHDAGESWASRRGDYCALVFRRGETIAAVHSDDGDAVDDRHAALMAAAPDLRATALDALDRADEASAECVKVRTSWSHASQRADAAEQERDALRARVAEFEAALRHRVARCEECDAIATRRGTFDSSPFYHDLCDDCARACAESTEEPHAATLRSLDAPALAIDDAACAAIDGAATAGPHGVDANGSHAGDAK